MTLLSYEQHEGDVGDDTKIEDEVSGAGGEDRPTRHVRVHFGTTKETDNIRHQEENDMHGNFAVTWTEQKNRNNQYG